jgi:hypothetical protein
VPDVSMALATAITLPADFQGKFDLNGEPVLRRSDNSSPGDDISSMEMRDYLETYRPTVVLMCELTAAESL